MGQSLKREENEGRIITNSGQRTSHRAMNIPEQDSWPLETGEQKFLKTFVCLVVRSFFSHARRRWVVPFILGESIANRVDTPA